MLGDQAKLITWCKHIAEAYNGGHVDISDDNICTFHHPGLSYRHFDQNGNPHIVDTMHFLNEIRNVSLLTHTGPNGSNHLDFRELNKGRLIFMLSTEIEIDKDFYDRNTPKWPIRAANSLGYVGNSSITINVKVSPPDKDITLLSQTSCYALVDRETRKSKPFPDWYKTKYGGKGLNKGPCRVETLNKPSERFHNRTTVMWTDTDRNNHTNFAMYVQYTINALRAALRLRARQKTANGSDEKKNTVLQNASETVSNEGPTPTRNCTSDSNAVLGLRGINQDIVESGLKSVRICYSKESVEGDVLDVHLWQEEGDDLKVKAIVEREGMTLCHIHLEYFGTVTSNL